MTEVSSIACVEEEDYFEEHHDFDLNFSYNDWVTLRISASKMIKMSEHNTSYHNQQPQDADYSCNNLSSLSDELESLIFARFPISEHWKLHSLFNKRCSNLVRSGDLYKIRNEINLKEPSIFMSASGENTWWAFDREFKSRRKIPVLPSDDHCFISGDKESLSAGTHLLVSGKEINGFVVWRYDLAQNKWCKGPSMITPRCLFASATCDTFAYVAGGRGAGELYDTAEKYNAETGLWDPLPSMKKKRHLCAGAYMDGKFYVIGGRNENGDLTCGEFFDEGKNKWELIPNMLKDDPVPSSHSPPLVAVVNNELYRIETSTNQMKVYLKKTNSWREMGNVPVRADYHRGWGVAFKSLGNELLVIGAKSSLSYGNCMAVYTCCLDLDSGEELKWRAVDGGRDWLKDFILTCCVMVA